MLGDPIVYWILQSILLFTLFFTGYGITYKDKNGKNFWQWGFLSIMAYGLIHGLRYMRGRDYEHYMGDLSGDRFTDYSEWLYNLWLDIFNFLGLHFSIGFVCYSTFLIFSFLMVIKRIPQVAVWALPLFLLMLPESENLIRQYAALSFILLAYQTYLDSNCPKITSCRIHEKLLPLRRKPKRKKYGKRQRQNLFCQKETSCQNQKKNSPLLQQLSSRLINKSYMVLLLFCFLSWSIHYSALFPIAILLFLIAFQKTKFTFRFPVIWLAVYIWLFFYWDISWFSYVAEWLNEFEIEDENGAGHYLADADRWFSEQGSISLVIGEEYKAIGIINKTVKFLSECAVIWYGFKVMAIKKEFSVIYVFTYIAILLKTISADIEIYNRLAQWLLVMMPILYGLILVNVRLRKIEKYAIGSVFFILWGIYGFLHEFGKIGYSGCAFIWDIM